MKCARGFAALSFVVVAPLAAQRFEGTIRFVANAGGEAQADTFTQVSKGSSLRWGPLIDDDSIRYLLIPQRKQYLEMSGESRGYSDVILLPKNGHISQSNITDTVAGIPCERWHYAGTNRDGSADVSDTCITINAGLMLNRQGGHTALYFAAGGYSFRDLYRFDTGILKVTQNGKTTFEVVSAQQMSTPDSAFVPPRKYTRLTASQMQSEHKP